MVRVAGQGRYDNEARHARERLLRLASVSGFGRRNVETDSHGPANRPDDPGADDPPSRLVGDRYQLHCLIGHGGVGRVYRARHVVTGREVALKRLAPGLVHDPDLIARSIEEAKIATTLRHPNIVDVLDAGLDPDGLPFLVMEYLEGESLEDWLRVRGPATWSVARDILLQIANGLAFAHAHGVIHRDLKAANIMVEPNESLGLQCKLIDFGLAHLAPERFSKTWHSQRGQPIGSPPTMSPEQVRGDAVDARSDVYSLGCLAYRLLAGQYPFAADNYAGYMYAHLFEAAPHLPPDLNDGADRDRLDALVQRCLAKDSADRPQSMEDVVDEIIAISAPISQHARERRIISGHAAKRSLRVALSLSLAAMGLAAISSVDVASAVETIRSPSIDEREPTQLGPAVLPGPRSASPAPTSPPASSPPKDRPQEPSTSSPTNERPAPASPPASQPTRASGRAPSSKTPKIHAKTKRSTPRPRRAVRTGPSSKARSSPPTGPAPECGIEDKDGLIAPDVRCWRAKSKSKRGRPRPQTGKKAPTNALVEPFAN